MTDDREEHSGKAAYTIDEFGPAHGVGRSTTYAEIAAGRLKCRKVGRKTIILAEDASAWRHALPAGGRTNAAA